MRLGFVSGDERFGRVPPASGSLGYICKFLPIGLGPEPDARLQQYGPRLRVMCVHDAVVCEGECRYAVVMTARR